MTNEQIVQEIQNGFSVTVNMELLYANNLPLIKKFIKPYVNYDAEEDLLQEAYFGLVDAVQHYKAEEGVLFMTYARYWVCQRVQRYIEEYCSVIRIPSNYRQKINRYKKRVQEFQQIHNRIPTDQDMAAFMNVSVEAVQNIRRYMTDIQSIDQPLQGREELCFGDTVQSDSDVENNTVDKIYEDYQKNELWGIVDRYTDRRQQNVIKRYFKDGQTLSDISRETGQSIETIRKQKDDGLRILRTGEAVREIREKLDLLDASAYRSGISQYRNHNYTSMVEYIAMRRTELEKRYKQVLNG